MPPSDSLSPPPHLKYAFLLQLDVDIDGALNPVQFLALAMRTLRRLQNSTIPPKNKGSPRRTTDDSGSQIEPGQHGRHRLATTAAKGHLKSATQQAAARLKSADPNGFGIITFSQCVRHLALDDG